VLQQLVRTTPSFAYVQSVSIQPTQRNTSQNMRMSKEVWGSSWLWGSSWELWKFGQYALPQPFEDHQESSQLLRHISLRPHRHKNKKRKRQRGKGHTLEASEFFDGIEIFLFGTLRHFLLQAFILSLLSLQIFARLVLNQTRRWAHKREGKRKETPRSFAYEALISNSLAYIDLHKRSYLSSAWTKAPSDKKKNSRLQRWTRGTRTYFWLLHTIWNTWSLRSKDLFVL
jgi:hypothetical protein